MIVVLLKSSRVWLCEMLGGLVGDCGVVGEVKSVELSEVLERLVSD